MDWDEQSVKRYDYLTVLVTNIRDSSGILAEAPHSIARDFIRELAGNTRELLGEFPNGEYRISSFLGDGFLIFFSEPQPDDVDRLGPTRAVKFAVQMSKVFAGLRNNPDYPPIEGMAQLRLAAGITCGPVLYGNLTGDTYLRTTGLTRTVALAFRLAHRRRSEPILIAKEARREIKAGFVFSNQVTFTERGIGQVQCFEVLGEEEGSGEPAGGTQTSGEQSPVKRSPIVYPAGLTEAEIRVLRHLAKGLPAQKIADDLVLSVHTINAHIQSIYGKVAIRNRGGIVRWAIEQGLA